MYQISNVQVSYTIEIFLNVLPMWQFDKLLFVMMRNSFVHESVALRALTLEAVTFEIFLCRNERIWTLRGGVRWAGPQDPPM